ESDRNHASNPAAGTSFPQATPSVRAQLEFVHNRAGIPNQSLHFSKRHIRRFGIGTLSRAVATQARFFPVLALHQFSFSRIRATGICRFSHSRSTDWYLASS